MLRLQKTFILLTLITLFALLVSFNNKKYITQTHVIIKYKIVVIETLS